jgi:transcriptional regulator
LKEKKDLMAKERIFNLPETKGAFQLKGIVTGTKKDGFSKSLKTKTNKDMNIVNFGVEYDEGKTLFVNLQGTETDNVYFSKKAEKKGDKPETVAVPWANRFTYNREGFKLIGKNIGVTKKLDEKGNEVNDKKVLTDFDACKEVAEHLGVTEYDIANALDSLREPVSMYEPIYNDGGDTIYLFDQISNKKEEYDLDYRLAVDKAMNKLKIRDRQIIEERFIIGKTQMEIASELGISQAQISRIEKNAIKTLKKSIK